MGYCQEEGEGHQTQKQRRVDSKHQGNLGFHNSRAMPQADCLNATAYQGSDEGNQVLKIDISVLKVPHFD